MGDYEHSAEMASGARQVYEYVAEVGNLPEYMSAIQSVRPTGDGRTSDVTAVVDGQRVEGQAWLETDDAAQALRWGAAGPNGYHGELTVTGDDSRATVTVTLHTEHADGPGVRAGAEETLANIKRVLEGRSSDPA